MMSKKFVGTVLLFNALYFLSSCVAKQETAKEFSEEPVLVTTAVATTARFNGSFEATGLVEAAQTSQISTRTMGYINKITVKTGDHIKKGQLLFSINSADLLAKKGQAEAGVAQAEAALKDAQKDLDRYTVLFKQQSATAKELDNITLRFQSSKAALEAARQMRNEVEAQFSYADVHAPFDGTVSQKMMEAGSLATPGMPVLTIEQDGALQVSANVSESMIGKIKEGQEAKMFIHAVDKTLEGKVIQINPSSLLTGGQFTVKLALNQEKGILPGMYVNVVFSSHATQEKENQREESIYVPDTAIIQRDQLRGIYTISSGKRALLRWLRTGKSNGGQTEVLTGLEAGDTFITSASSRLYNGVPVKY